MSRNVVILVDNSPRDLLACRLVQDELRARGARATLCSKRSNAMVLRRERPDAYVSSRGDFPWLRSIAECCDVYVLPAEGARLTNETMTAVFTGRAGDAARSHADLPRDAFRFIRRAYLWGPETRDVLMKTGLFESEQLMVTGNARFDLYRERGHRVRKPGERLRIGVAFSAKTTSAFNGELDYARTFYGFEDSQIDKVNLVQPGRNLEDWMWRDLAALRVMMRTVRRIVETTDHEIVLRVGMQEDVEDYRFLESIAPDRITIQDRRGQLYDFFSDIDVLLTCTSTIGFEALVVGVPVIATLFTVDYDHLVAHISPRTNGLELLSHIYHCPESEDQVFELLGRVGAGELPLSPDPDFLAGFLQRMYNWPMERSAAAAVADDIVAAPPRSGVRGCFRTAIPFGNAAVERATSLLPLPDHLAVSVMGPFAAAKFALDDLRTGAFRSNREHYRTRNPQVDALLRQREPVADVSHPEGAGS